MHLAIASQYPATATQHIVVKNYKLGHGISSLKSCAATVLTDSEDLNLHNKVLSLRLKVYAHSDGDSHLLTGFNYNGPGPKFTNDPFAMLDQWETRRLKSICDRWIAYLEEQRAALKALSHQHAQIGEIKRYDAESVADFASFEKG
jgi:hypothetical protein